MEVAEPSAVLIKHVPPEDDFLVQNGNKEASARDVQEDPNKDAQVDLEDCDQRGHVDTFQEVYRVSEEPADDGEPKEENGVGTDHLVDKAGETHHCAGADASEEEVPGQATDG